MEWVELKQFCDKQKPGNDLKTAAQRRKWVENTFGYQLHKDLCWYTQSSVHLRCLSLMRRIIKTSTGFGAMPYHQQRLPSLVT